MESVDARPVVLSPASVLPAKLPDVPSLRLASLLYGLALLPLVPRPASAQDSLPTPPPAVGKLEARRFAGVLALGALAYLADDAVRDRVRDRTPGDDGAVDDVFAFADHYGDPGVAVAALALWGTGLVSKRHTVAVVGLRAVEAVGVSGLTTVLLKELTGRARPRVAPHDPANWQLLRPTRSGSEDHRAMPSGHATAVFAFATAVTGEVARRAPEHALWVGTSTYALAMLTAWQRMRADAHWLSDVTVGAGIGTVTALAILRWHDTRPDNPIDRWFLRPVVQPTPSGATAVGLRLTWP